MWNAAAVLACALAVLGRSESSMPRIELIDIAPPDVSVGAEAYVQRDTNTIYPDHIVIRLSNGVELAFAAVQRVGRHSQAREHSRA